MRPIGRRRARWKYQVHKDYVIMGLDEVIRRMLKRGGEAAKYQLGHDCK